MSTDPKTAGYKTHILIGVRANGVMTVIADWPHVPKQTEVQKEIEIARDGYVTFVLCTPTAIIPVADIETRRETDHWDPSDVGEPDRRGCWDSTHGREESARSRSC